MHVHVLVCGVCVARSTKGGYLIRVMGTSLGFRGVGRRILVATHQQPNVTLYENGTEVPNPTPYPPDWRVRTGRMAACMHRWTIVSGIPTGLGVS
jgi:hypothetical protein